MNRTKKVSIIVLNWNNKKDTAECLDSLLQVDYPNYQVLLVDNGSTDGSAEYFREQYRGLQMIENRTNLYFAEGNNVALRQLLAGDSDYFFLVNNDTIVDRNILQELVKIGESSAVIGVVGPKIYYYQPNNVIWHAGGRLNYWRCDFGSIGIRQEDRGQFDQVRDVDYVAGCGLLIKKEVVRQIGLLDNSYVMYMDDPDWCVRAKINGYRVVYAPAAKMWHKVSASSGGGLTPFKAYYKGKNTIKFFWQYAKWYHWLTLPLFAGMQLAAGLGRELRKGNVKILKPLAKGVMDYFTANLSAPVKSLYEKIFREELSENVAHFLKNLSYVVLGFGLARFISAIFNIVSGRWLGPAEYGKFSLLLSVAMFLIIPALFGLNSGMIKYCAEKEDRNEQQRIIMTGLVLAGLLISVWSLIYLWLAIPLARLFGVSLFVFKLALIFAIIYAVNSMITSILQGLHLLKPRSFWELFSAVILLIIFLLLVLIRQDRSFMVMFYPTSIAFALVSTCVLWQERRYLGLIFSREWAGKLLAYGFYGMIVSLAVAFLNNIDKILINKFLQPQDLGIYKAYYTASIGMAGSLVALFVTAFFPQASRSKAKERIFSKITRFVPYFFIVGIPATLAFEFVVLKLYGRAYPLDLTNLLLFSLATVLTLLYSSYDWLMAAVGRRGIRISMWGVVIAGTANWVLNVYLIPAYHIRGAIMALILSYLLALVFVISQKKVLLHQEE